jgi:hypothetical protein
LTKFHLDAGFTNYPAANVLAKLPKSQQPKAKRALQEIWMAETKAAAELAFDAFIESYTPKYEKAADCLSRDRDALLAFYDFPAEHWKHLRTTNPIESTSPSVNLSSVRGCSLAQPSRPGPPPKSSIEMRRINVQQNRSLAVPKEIHS